ncbi:MAG: ZPR1 zinc finger domain-containing protein [Candidatus Hydrothermarchaeaceae archaeon]
MMETTILCDSCGYRHSEVFTLEEKGPVRYEMTVSAVEDMSVRVVRSSKSTIEVPELGVKITPGQEAEGFVSNVEGVLERIADVLLSVKSLGHGKKVAKANELLKRIDGIKMGEEKIHLVITDPTGNSAIISDKAKVRGMGGNAK